MSAAEPRVASPSAAATAEAASREQVPATQDAEVEVQPVSVGRGGEKLMEGLADLLVYRVVCGLVRGLGI